MEVNLPRQSIRDFSDPIALEKELEHLQEGHYTRRLHDYILKEIEQLINSISVEPTLLPIRDELYGRIPTSGFVTNTLEQLGILHIEQRELSKKLEDLHKLVEKANRKFKEFKNNRDRRRCWFLKSIFFWHRFYKRVEFTTEVEELYRYYEKTGNQICKLRDDLIFRAFCKYKDIWKQVLQRDNITGVGIDGDVDGVLRLYLTVYNVAPASLTISETLTEMKMDKMNVRTSFFERYLKWYNEDEEAESNYWRDGLALYGNVLIFCIPFICKIIFRKPILLVK